jgi:serine/threonine protein kinase
MQNLTPNSNLNLKAEIAFFEALEQYAQLSLGELTKLRKKSRVEHKNLLQLCLDDQVISSEMALSIFQRIQPDFPHEQLSIDQKTVNYFDSLNHYSKITADIPEFKTPLTLPQAYPTPSPTTHPADDFAIQDKTPVFMNSIYIAPTEIPSDDSSSDPIADIAQDTLEFEDEDFEKADFVYLPIKIEEDFFQDLGQKLHIFEAKNICLERKYESIVLDENASAIELKTFKRGYQCLSLFDKPYFPKIYDFALTSDQRYIVNLQNIQGISLIESMKTKELSWLKRGVYLWQLCYLMAQIHKHKILFLNLNPKMIEVCSFGLRLRAWQLACPIDLAPEELALSLLHDPDFCAPELLNHQSLSFQNDVYSLGAVVFWIYTHQAPPKDEKITESMIDRIREMPQNIKKACIKALSVDPQHRQQNALLFYEDCFAANVPMFQKEESSRHTAFTSDHALSIFSKEIQHLAIHYEASIFPSIYEPLSQHLPWMNLFTLGVAPEAELRLKLDQWPEIKIRRCAPIAGENQKILHPVSYWEEGIYELTWGMKKEYHLQLLLKANEKIELNPFDESLFEHSCPLRQSVVSIGSVQPKARELSLHFIEIPNCAPKSSKCTKRDYLLFLQQLSLADRYMRLPLGWQITEHQIIMSDDHQDLLSGISFLDAQAYCLWYSQSQHKIYELMSESIWERLARGAGCDEWIGSGEYDLLDLEEQNAEFVVHSQDWALLKGGKLSKGRVAWRQVISISEKLENIGFRLCLMI